MTIQDWKLQKCAKSMNLSCINLVVNIDLPFLKYDMYAKTAHPPITNAQPQLLLVLSPISVINQDVLVEIFLKQNVCRCNFYFHYETACLQVKTRTFLQEHDRRVQLRTLNDAKCIFMYIYGIAWHISWNIQQKFNINCLRFTENACLTQLPPLYVLKIERLPLSSIL